MKYAEIKRMFDRLEELKAMVDVQTKNLNALSTTIIQLQGEINAVKLQQEQQDIILNEIKLMVGA